MEVDCFGKCYMVKELDCWVAEINQFDHLGRSAEKKGWFFSTVFSNVPSIACLNGCKVALHLFDFSPLCVLKLCLKLSAFMKYNHTCCIVSCWNGFSPECAVMLFYVLSQNVVGYHISTTQISNKICWNYFSPECGVVLFKRAFKFTAKEDAKSHWLHWFDMSSNTLSFMVTKTST